MINKESNEKKKPDDAFTVSVNAHITIKDKQSGKELVNKRG